MEQIKPLFLFNLIQICYEIIDFRPFLDTLMHIFLSISMSIFEVIKWFKRGTVFSLQMITFERFLTL